MARLYALRCKAFRPMLMDVALLKGAVMALIARILDVSLLTSVLVAGLLLALIRPDCNSSDILVILACVGSIIGAIAGAAREIVSARRCKTQSGRNHVAMAITQPYEQPAAARGSQRWP
jgi:hypothetical protein